MGDVNYRVPRNTDRRFLRRARMRLKWSAPFSFQLFRGNFFHILTNGLNKSVAIRTSHHGQHLDVI